MFPEAIWIARGGGLEPPMAVPETAVLPITPSPKDLMSVAKSGDSSHFGEGTDLRLSTHEVRVGPIGLANVWLDVAETGVRKVFERALGSPRST